MRLISVGEAARLLGLDPQTLKRRETPDGKWAEVYGSRIRVYRIDLAANAQRRYDGDEITRLLVKMQRSR